MIGLLERWQLRICRLTVVVALVSLAGCAAGPGIGGAPKHLYSSEATTVRSIELRVLATTDASARASDSESGADLHQQFLPGVNPMIPANPTGVIGSTIGLAIVHTIVASERREKQLRRASEVAEQVRVLQSQLSGVDLASAIRMDVEEHLGRAHAGGTFPFDIRSSIAGERREADAVLTIAVSHAFYDWALPRRAGVPPPPAGILLDVRAVVTLLAANGKLLMRDTIVFETPHSEDPDEAVRVAWWAQAQRYRALMMLTGRAIGAALTEEILGGRLLSDESEYVAELKLQNQKSTSERESRLDAALDRFRRCYGLEGKPLVNAKFQTLRAQIDGDVYVGLRCDVARTR